MFAKFFIDRPVFAWVIALVILLAGAIAIKFLPLNQYPPVAPPGINFRIAYPGASAKVVEETVTALIEQEMNGIERLLYMESTSEMGNGSVTLVFEPGTNVDISSVEAQNRFKRVEARLPDDVRRIGVQVTKQARNYVMIVALVSPDGSRSQFDLGSYAGATVLDSIRRVKGVGEAQLFGTEYSMRLWLQPEKLTAYNLTPADIKQAVRAQNVELATGEIGQAPAAKGQEISAPIIVPSRLATAEEFGEVLVRTLPNGAAVRVKDVARVELGAATYEVLSRKDGQPSAAIAVRAAPDGNALDVVEAVRNRMQEMEKSFPKGVAWDVPYDTSNFVKISIKEVVVTLIEAVILVFLVMYLFLENIRATLIPTIVVPVALAGAVAGLYVFGFSINVLTLFALVLAIGILVDDAIVVVEAVERIMSSEGLSPRDATRKAMDQIINAIIGMTLVLTAVFAPMLFMGGSVGVIYRQFAATLILTMLFSALMALSLTPALCASLLKHAPGKELMPSKGFFGWFNRVFARTTQGYCSWVERIIRKTGRFLIIYGLIIVAAVALFLHLPTSFLPDEDQGYFLSVIQLPPGATMERTGEIVDQVEAYYRKQPEVDKVMSIIGFSIFGRGQNAAMSFVRLKDWSERKGEKQSAQAFVQRANMAFFQIKQAMIFAINPPPIPELASTGGFDFRLQDRGGMGRDKLLEVRNMALGLAGKDPRLAGVRPEGQEAGPQLLLEVDRRKTETLGVSMAELNDTLQSALGASYVNDFERQGRILRVQMQADAQLRSSPEEILRLTVRNRTGNMVPLSELVKPRWTIGAPKVDRYNGVSSMKIAGSAAPGRSTGEAMKAMEEVAAKLPQGFGFEWTGTSYEEKLSGSEAPFLFALSLIVVFLSLAALYESWSIPFAVMLVVPLGIFGSALGVTLRGLPNDVYFKVGLIAIIGLSSKNAILIIEYARELQERGMSLFDATLEACRLRFRPILMTSMAFILGVLPLAISTGAGANSRHAIGTGVIGGMLAATFLAIFLVPVFFVVVRKLFPGHARHHQEESHE
ncbi:MAG: hydrophobe/amphiphile efflux family transporter [Proteobacteria bacterium]|nr:hydrophobe/amphiphile efflux family transporter [Pseudomonadota bacterium]